MSHGSSHAVMSHGTSYAVMSHGSSYAVLSHGRSNAVMCHGSQTALQFFHTKLLRSIRADKELMAGAVRMNIGLAESQWQTSATVVNMSLTFIALYSFWTGHDQICLS